jgi:hypothetical protein
MPSTENIAAFDAVLEAAEASAPPPEPSAEDAERSIKRSELMRTMMMHNAQKRSLELQAENEVNDAMEGSEAASRQAAEAERERIEIEHNKEMLKQRQLTAEARENLSAQVAERIGAAGTGHMRSSRLWSEALLRRQAEDANIHARRLRQQAHAAADSALGEKGEALQSELASIKALMAGARNVLEPVQTAHA